MCRSHQSLPLSPFLWGLAWVHGWHMGWLQGATKNACMLTPSSTPKAGSPLLKLQTSTLRLNARAPYPLQLAAQPKLHLLKG